MGLALKCSVLTPMATTMINISPKQSLNNKHYTNNHNDNNSSNAISNATNMATKLHIQSITHQNNIL